MAGGPPVQVLHLEDDPRDAELVGAYLVKIPREFRIVVAVDRASFKTYLNMLAFDLIISDHALPTFDGLEALRMVRDLDPDVPFIFVSGVMGEERAVDALHKGATDYVLKQRLARLPRVVSRALGEAESHRQKRLADQEIRALNDRLERRVAERTTELAAANQQLRDQIQRIGEADETIRRMQRLESIGQVTAGLAHDFNNLLTVILGNLEMLGRIVKDPRAMRRTGFMKDAAERASAIADHLLAFSRNSRLSPQLIDLNDVILSLTPLLTTSIGPRVRLNTSLTGIGAPIFVDRTELEMVVLNLAINARDAMGGDGELTLSTRRLNIDDPSEFPAHPPTRGWHDSITLRDTGSGIPDEILSRVFEPFFTTKEAGKGTGLGLAQVLNFVRQSGGGLRIATTLDVGTTIEIVLPSSSPSAAALDQA